MPTTKYGLVFPDFYSPAAIELACFDRWHSAENGGLGRYGHFKNALKLLFPDREYNPWDDLRARAFCDRDNWVEVGGGSQLFHSHANVGCASSGKTDFWATVAVLWWMANPMESSVAITSIHKKMIRQRSWSIIQRCYHALNDGKFGQMIDSQMEWRAAKGDGKHSIMALAAGEGETNKAVQALAGLHTKRIMIVIDEASATPDAIFNVITNLRKGASEFIVVAAGNAHSRMDAFGRFCEPKGGWNSVDEDTEIFDTAGVKEWDVEPGVCIHFHGKRSPNVRAGKTIYPYLYTLENHLASKGKEDSLYYWAYDAGWFPPEGVSNTIFDEPTVIKCSGMTNVTWEDTPLKVAALDPAFGGDECVLRLGKIGKPEDGPRCLEVGEKFLIKLKQKSPTPVHYQIARQVMDICQKNGIEGKNFAMDTTGNGGGVAAVLQAEWSPMILKVEFGGAPSEMPVSNSDGRTCKEVYDRRVSELWFNCRELLEGKQLRGLDRETVVQFCKRVYDLETKKKRVETKDKMKERVGRSPDDADCVSVMVELARHRGLATTGIPMKGGTLSQLRMKAALEADEVYHTEDEPTVNEPSYLSWLED
jgi:hypothetical protein